MTPTRSATLRTPSPGGIVELLVLALPMVVSHACETLMMFVDRLFLSRLGPEYMSAAMGGGITCFLFMTFFMGLTGYANALVAQHLGAGQRDRCATMASQALLVSLLAWPFMLLAMPLGQRLFLAMGIAPGQIGPQTQYFRILLCGTGIILFRNSLSAFFSGIGRTHVVMIATAVSMLVNIAANYVLIFGRLGFPALGMEGAAIGTLLGSAVALLIMAAVYFGKHYRADFGVAKALRVDRAALGKLLRLGSPTGLEMFLNILAFDLMILNFHSYGVDVAAAVTITFNWDMVFFIPLLGMGIGVTSLVGRYMGAGDPDTAHRSTLSAIKVVSVYSAAGLLAFGLFPQPLVHLFRPASSNGTFAEVMPLAIFMVRLMSLYVFADAINVTFSAALRGAGDTFWTMVLSVAGHWALTLGVAFMIRVVHAEPRATWCVAVGLVILLGVLFFLRYRSGAWRTLRVVEPPPPPVHEDMEVPF